MIFFGKTPSGLRKFKERPIRVIVIIFGGLLGLALGIWGKSITENIFYAGYPLFEAKFDIIKFVITTFVSFFFYHYVIAKIKSFDKLAPPDLGFNSVAISIVSFFVIILGYMTLFGKA